MKPIDLDELVQSWINGNRTWVIRQLPKTRPDLAAAFVLDVRTRCGEHDAHQAVRALVARFAPKEPRM
jgi:hypothetical protein